MDLKKTRRILSGMFWVPVALAAAVAAAGETDLIAIAGGDAQTEFATVTIMELLTIALIPAALYMFRTAGVRRSLAKDKWTALCKWGTLRLAMITLPLLANTLLYYIYMNVSFIYMAIIGLICTIFVYPSASRCTNETE